MPALAPPSIADAGVGDAAIGDAAAPEVTLPPKKIACDPGTSITPAPAPEPTWFCGRSDGVRDGAYVTLFPDGVPEVLGHFKNGKLNGPWQRNYPDGAIAEQGTYAGGVKDGVWQQFGPTGAVLGEYTLVHGTGIERRWYDDGPLYMERTLKAGLARGAVRIFDHAGAVVVSAMQFGTRYDGPHIVGTKNTLRLEERFSRGVRQGPRQLWQFGALIIDENYDRQGKLDHAYAIWRDRTTPRVQGTYDHGKRVGAWSWFDRNNNKEREGDFAADQKVGTWFEWLETKLVSSGTYTNGKPDGEFVYFDKTGIELGHFSIKDGTGVMMTFHPNQQPATKQHLLKGALDGVYQELTTTGKVVVDGRYANNRKHGLWREWTDLGVLTLEQHWRRGKLDGAVKKYDGGKLVSAANYKNGNAAGEYMEYQNDKPSLTGQYLDGRRTGTWTSYDSEGNAVVTATYKNGVLDGEWRQLASGVVIAGNMVAGRRSGTWTRTDASGTSTTVTYEP